MKGEIQSFHSVPQTSSPATCCDSMRFDEGRGDFWHFLNSPTIPLKLCGVQHFQNDEHTAKSKHNLAAAAFPLERRYHTQGQKVRTHTHKPQTPPSPRPPTHSHTHSPCVWIKAFMFMSSDGHNVLCLVPRRSRWSWVSRWRSAVSVSEGKWAQPTIWPEGDWIGV